MLKKNSLAIGIITGIIVPVIVFFLLYFFTFYKVIHSLASLFSTPSLLAKMVALSLIGNLGAFIFVLNKLNLELTARGILMATFFYAIVIGALKLMEMHIF